MVKKILAQLEKLAYWLQIKYMKAKITNELVGPHFAFFHPHDNSQQILNLYKIRFARIIGRKIVLVTGCFDILHQEHFKFLKKAKQEGDILVVGLESDKRIKKMKGAERPINCFKIRAANLVRLNEVDFVLELPDDFDKKTVRLNFIRSIGPQVLAISGHDPKERAKRRECREINCQLKIVHRYNPKISTTKLLLDKT